MGPWGCQAEDLDIVLGQQRTLDSTVVVLREVSWEAWSHPESDGAVVQGDRDCALEVEGPSDPSLNVSWNHWGSLENQIPKPESLMGRAGMGCTDLHL